MGFRGLQKQELTRNGIYARLWSLVTCNKLSGL